VTAERLLQQQVQQLTSELAVAQVRILAGPRAYCTSSGILQLLLPW
jgi:hypothetical protein